MVTPADIAERVAPIGPDAGAERGAEPEAGEAPATAPARRSTGTQFKVRHVAVGVPVVGFTGVNGAGKTLLAVSCAVDEMRAGRTVYSTVQIDSPWGSSIPLVSLRQLLEVPRGSLLVLDEISVIFPSTSRNHLPDEVAVLLQVMRHRELTLFWTAPNWMRAHNLLRIATQAIANVSPLLARRVGDSPWKTPRMIMVGLMDTTDGAVDEQPTKFLRRRMYLPKRLSGWGAYDTLADTPFLGMKGRGGLCPDCGGTRQPPKHSRELHEALGVPWFDD